VLDDVADRNDAHQAVLLEHRHVPELAGGHALHHTADGLGLAASHDLAGHHLRQRRGERARAQLRQRAHDVALGQDADHALIRAQHHQGADAVLGQHGDGGFERCLRLDGGDVAALEGQYRFDVHWSPPWTGSCVERSAHRSHQQCRYGSRVPTRRYA
jgi:hypothetical protein